MAGIAEKYGGRLKRLVPVTGSGQQSIAIRGITSSFIANLTVGITINDVPYGSSTLLVFGATKDPTFDVVNGRVQVRRDRRRCPIRGY